MPYMLANSEKIKLKNLNAFNFKIYTNMEKILFIFYKILINI